jgi:hypothetical protein
MEVWCPYLEVSGTVTIGFDQLLKLLSIVALGAQHKVSSSAELEQQPVGMSMKSFTLERMMRVLVSTELY